MKSFWMSLVVGGLLSLNVLADVPSCGPNCTYTLTENGVDAKGNTTYSLTIEPVDISKNASVGNYSRYGHEQSETDTNYAPWRFENITEVNIKQGIEAIGRYAFCDMKSITSLQLPEGLKGINAASFNGTKITSLDLPSTVTSISGYAFGGAPIENINGLPDGIQSIGTRAFTGLKFTDLVIPSSVTNLSESAFGDDTYNKALIENLYCEEKMVAACEAALQWRKDMGATVNVVPYQKTPNGQVFYNNKWYNSANDILSGHHAQKRIYSVDEANKVTGKKNSVSIRYK